MISLLKRELDPSVREDPRTQRLVQYFEMGYSSYGYEEKEYKETIVSFIRGLLLTILLVAFPTIPYGVVTFLSIINDAFNIRDALNGASAWCSKLKRSFEYSLKSSYGKMGQTDDSSEVDSDFYEDFPKKDDQESQYYTKVFSFDGKEKEDSAWEKKLMGPDDKEFIFVDFNAWEYAACVHSPYMQAL